ncbi:MAG: hypothetical protein LDL30_11210 [Desulfovibrio sp.]|nr:hypothetical protein [Desulfovibrio sp.]
MLGLGKRLEALHGVSQSSSEEQQRDYKNWSKGLLVACLAGFLIVCIIIAYSALAYRIEGVTASMTDSIRAIEARTDARMEAKAQEFFGKLEGQLAAMEAKQQALQDAALQGALMEMSLKAAALKLQDYPAGTKATLEQIEALLASLRQQASQ